MGRVTKIKDDRSNVLAQYTYDELSRRILLTLGNDANAVYEYDLANRLKKLTNKPPSICKILFSIFFR
jgi:YD repeat-containing protein